MAHPTNARSIHQRHFGWDNTLPPALTIAPGDAVEFHPMEASAGQITEASTVEDVKSLDFSKVNPVTGPVFIDGAKPGDVLKISLQSFGPMDWGWTANIPGFGLLANQFPDPALVLWEGARGTVAIPLWCPASAASPSGRSAAR